MADNDKQKLPFFLNDQDIAKWTGFWHSQRRVMISGELNGDSINKATQELMKLDYSSNEPITIMVNSGGGLVVPTHQLEDTISMLESPVDAVVLGDCASMAVDLVQMCRKRRMMPSARILVHYVRNDQRWISDDLEQLEVDTTYFRDRMKEMKERRLTLYVKRTGLSPEEISKLFRQGEVHRMFFTAKQAIDMHLADEIVTDFKLFPKKKEVEEKK